MQSLRFLFPRGLAERTGSLVIALVFVLFRVAIVFFVACEILPLIVNKKLQHMARTTLFLSYFCSKDAYEFVG